MQKCLNKFIEIKFSVDYMDWLWYCLLQHQLTSRNIDTICLSGFAQLRNFLSPPKESMYIKQVRQHLKACYIGTWFLYNSSAQADIALVNIGPIVVKYWEMDWQLNSKYQSLFMKVLKWALLWSESEIWGDLGWFECMSAWIYFIFYAFIEY